MVYSTMKSFRLTTEARIIVEIIEELDVTICDIKLRVFAYISTMQFNYKINIKINSLLFKYEKN